MLGRKHDSGKPMFRLLPWGELEEVVKTLNYGALKYGIDNWKEVENGEKRYQDAALRHIKAILVGEEKDKETNLHHYAHAIASLLFAFWHSKMRRVRKKDLGNSAVHKKVKGSLGFHCSNRRTTRSLEKLNK